MGKGEWMRMGRKGKDGRRGDDKRSGKGIKK